MNIVLDGVKLELLANLEMASSTIAETGLVSSLTAKLSLSTASARMGTAYPGDSKDFWWQVAAFNIRRFAEHKRDASFVSFGQFWQLFCADGSQFKMPRIFHEAERRGKERG